jgi:hypothetical protein
MQMPAAPRAGSIATSGGRFGRRRRGVCGLTAGDVMCVPPATLPSWWTVAEFDAHLGLGRDPAETFVLVDITGSPAGLVDVATLLRCTTPDSTRLRACHTRSRVVVAEAGTPLVDVLSRLARRRGDVAAVLDGHGVCGTVSAADVDRQVAADRADRAAFGRGASVPPERIQR